MWGIIWVTYQSARGVISRTYCVFHCATSISPLDYDQAVGHKSINLNFLKI